MAVSRRALLRRAATVSAAGLASLAAGCGDDRPTPPLTRNRTWTAGYAAGGNTPAGHAAYERAHGFPVVVYGTWDDHYTSFDQMTGGITGFVRATCLPVDGVNLNVIAPGLLLDRGENLATAAAGSDITAWTSCGEQLLRAGLNSATTILRVGHEFNGSWAPWSTHADDPTLIRHFIAAYRHAVQAIRVHAPLVRFDLCFAGGVAGTDIEAHYPGDDVVDIIGMDYYDGDSVGHTATSAVDFVEAQQGCGFAEIAASANAHGKLFALDEWALSGSQVSHDNPLFVREVFRTLAELNQRYPDIVSHETFFDDVRTGTFGWANNPQSAALYDTLWNS